MSVAQYLIESAAAREYLADCLDSGDPLSSSLLRLPIRAKGHVSALLPKGCEGPFRNVKEFSCSLGVKTVGAQPAIDDFAWRYLSSNRNAVAMFSALLLEGDKGIARRETPYVFAPPPAWWGNVKRRAIVYVQEASYATQDSVRIACSETRGFPSRFALMNVPSRLGPLPIGEYVDQERIDALTDFTDHIVLGAFDDESVLIWSAKAPQVGRYVVDENEVESQ